jgi:hypothetical protein
MLASSAFIYLFNMTLAEISHLRLQNQWITPHSPIDVKTVAAHLGVLQAQDYTHAKWAIGLRIPGSTDADIESAIDRGDIIRTHLLRPTWHFVAADDVRWMLALSAPQLRMAAIQMDRQLGMEEAVFKRCNTIIAKALEGGKQLTREELMAELQRAGIATNDLRAGHIMFRAETESIVCNGSRRGKQFTYALLDERVPKGKIPDRPDAIAELARRYFNSHAPATLHDFHWWSGLKMADARAGLEAVQPNLVQETIGNLTYWLPNDLQPLKTKSQALHLLPAFDEFLVSYKDRSASLDPSRKMQTITGNGIFKPVVVKNGWVNGIWQRMFLKDKVSIERQLFEEWGDVENEAFQQECARFAGFCGKSLVLKQE